MVNEWVITYTDKWDIFGWNHPLIRSPLILTSVPGHPSGGQQNNLGPPRFDVKQPSLSPERTGNLIGGFSLPGFDANLWAYLPTKLGSFWGGFHVGKFLLYTLSIGFCRKQFVWWRSWCVSPFHPNTPITSRTSQKIENLQRISDWTPLMVSGEFEPVWSASGVWFWGSSKWPPLDWGVRIL